MEQEHILNTHIDTLNAWWDEATPGIPKTGDTYIEDQRHRGRSFRIVEAATDHKYGFDNIRILARAPKPTPAWHDAVAVVAHKYGDYGLTPREVYVRRDGDRWESLSYYARHSALVDPVPLIEQKVTDEMRDRVRDYYRTEHQVEMPRDDVWLNDLLTAALGLDPA